MGEGRGGVTATESEKNRAEQRPKEPIFSKSMYRTVLGKNKIYYAQITDTNYSIRTAAMSKIASDVSDS